MERTGNGPVKWETSASRRRLRANFSRSQRMKVPVFCWLLIAVGVSAMKAHAAGSDSARLSGRVLDATGKKIPGAKVTVKRTLLETMDMKSRRPGFAAEDAHAELTLRIEQAPTCVGRGAV